MAKLRNEARAIGDKAAFFSHLWPLIHRGESDRDHTFDDRRALRVEQRRAKNVDRLGVSRHGSVDGRHDAVRIRNDFNSKRNSARLCGVLQRLEATAFSATRSSEKDKIGTVRVARCTIRVSAAPPVRMASGLASTILMAMASALSNGVLNSPCTERLTPSTKPYLPNSSKKA